MSRRDGGVVLVLLAVLAVLAGAVALPAFQPVATPAPTPTAAPSARSRAGRARPPLVDHPADGPDAGGPRPRGAPVPRPRAARARGAPSSRTSPSAGRSTEKGARWTFHLRPDAAWHDGVPVTSARRRLHGGRAPRPGLRGTAGLHAGPGRRPPRSTSGPSSSISGIRWAGSSRRRRCRSCPPTSSRACPSRRWPTTRSPASRSATGRSPSWRSPPTGPSWSPSCPRWRLPTAPLDDPGGGEVATRIPRLDAARAPLLRHRRRTSPRRFTAGEVESAGDLPPAAAAALAAATPGARRDPLPGDDAHRPRLQPAGGAVGRSRTRGRAAPCWPRSTAASLVEDLLGGAGARAETPIPPSSWAFDAKAAPVIAFDRAAASKGLRDAGWRRVDKAWIPPGASKPLAVTLLAPEAAANAIAHAAATRVAAAWTSLGLATTVEALPPGELVDRLRTARLHGRRHRRQHGPRSRPVPDPRVQPGPDRGRERLGDPGRRARQGARRRPGAGLHREPAEGLLRRSRSCWARSSRCPRSSSATASSWSAPTSRGRSRGPIADPGGRFWDVVRWRVVGR